LANVVIATYNDGNPMYDSKGNILDYQSNLERLSRIQLSELNRIPEGLRELLKVMLNAHGSIRPDAIDFGRAPYFDNVAVACLRYVSTLAEKTDENKAVFMKGLPDVIPTMNKRILLKKVLPPLIQETKTTIMIPFVLPNILLIAEDCSMVEFEQAIFPFLVPIFAVTDPVQVLQIFLHKMSVLLTKSPPAKIQEHVMPMVYRALEPGPQEVIQQLAMAQMPTFMHTLDYTVMKNEVIPRVEALVVATTIPGVRINGLVCLGKLLPIMDKWVVNENLITFLTTLEIHDAGCLMAIHGILVLIMQDKKYGVDAATVATRIIPWVGPLLIERALDASQCGKMIQLMRDLVAFIEHERLGSLRKSEALQSEANATTDIAATNQGSSSAAAVSSVLKAEAPKVFDVKAATAAAAAADQVAATKRFEAAAAAAAKQWEVAAPAAAPVVPMSSTLSFGGMSQPSNGGNGSSIFGKSRSGNQSNGGEASFGLLGSSSSSDPDPFGGAAQQSQGGSVFGNPTGSGGGKIQASSPGDDDMLLSGAASAFASMAMPAATSAVKSGAFGTTAAVAASVFDAMPAATQSNVASVFGNTAAAVATTSATSAASSVFGGSSSSRGGGSVFDAMPSSSNNLMGGAMGGSMMGSVMQPQQQQPPMGGGMGSMMGGLIGSGGSMMGGNSAGMPDFSAFGAPPSASSTVNPISGPTGPALPTSGSLL
jgi:SCY1-like protein 2